MRALTGTAVTRGASATTEQALGLRVEIRDDGGLRVQEGRSMTTVGW